MSLYNDDATKYFWKSTFPNVGQFLVEFLLCAVYRTKFLKVPLCGGGEGWSWGAGRPCLIKVNFPMQ